MKNFGKDNQVFSWLVGVLIVGLLIFGGIPLATAQKKATVTFWSPYPLPFYEPWTSWMPETFNKLHPNIKVEVTGMPWARIKDKLLPAMAAGSPPDLVQLNGGPIVEYVARGYVVPIDKFIENDPLVNLKDWFLDRRRRVTYKDHVYGLPFEADSLVFYWNKGYFREAGLNPEKIPRFLSELDIYAEKLTKKDSKGEYDVLGFIPWGGKSERFEHWVWKNHGKLYDPETGKITAADPRNVEMLEWEVGYAKKYGATKIGALQESVTVIGDVTGVSSEFAIGLVAMQAGGSYLWSQIDKYGPDIDYGMSPYVPIPKGGIDAGIAGGSLIWIPVGSKGVEKNPEAVWEFMKWYSIVAMQVWCLQVGDLVPRPEYVDLWMFASSWKVRASLEALKFTHPYPNIPVIKFYRDQLMDAVEYAVHGEKTPKQALEDVERTVQAELSRLIKK